MIKVPHFDEYSAMRIMEQVRAIPKFRQYLPDLDHMVKPLNREYLFNIINTVDPTYFGRNIRHSYEMRKLESARNSQRQCTITEQMYNLIVNSNQITTGKYHGQS